MLDTAAQAWPLKNANSMQASFRTPMTEDMWSYDAEPHQPQNNPGNLILPRPNTTEKTKITHITFRAPKTHSQDIKNNWCPKSKRPPVPLPTQESTSLAW